MTWNFYIWQFIHNCLVHFLMGVLGQAPDWLVDLHDYTAAKAWPEVVTGPECLDKPSPVVVSSKYYRMHSIERGEDGFTKVTLFLQHVPTSLPDADVLHSV